jgi:hypothetical protein
MKKLAIISLLALCAAGAYAQGTLIFFNNISGSVVTHIYSPDPSNPGVETQGLAANDYPSGTTVFNGTALGGSLYTGNQAGLAGVSFAPSSTVWTYGNLFSAQVYASPAGDGSGNPPAFSSLTAVSQYVTTLATTAGNAGFIIQPTLATDPGIPGTGYDNSGRTGAAHILNNANVALVAWYNGLGAYPTYESAAGVPRGNSAVYILSSLGEPASVTSAAHTGSPTPATPMSPGFPTGLTSFDLVTPIPEPATIALGVLGACAFLARRKK